MNHTIKTALVTGGTKGIGRAIVERLVKDDFFVIVNYANDQNEAESFLQYIKKLGGKATAIKANVANEIEVSEGYGKPWKTIHSVNEDEVINEENK